MTLVQYQTSPLQWVRNELDNFGWLSNKVRNVESIFDWKPNIDIEEMEDRYLVKVDIPGIEPKQVKVNITDGLLTIQGVRDEEKTGKGIYERETGKFARQIQLPKAIDDTRISAKGKNGVLEITVPKEKHAAVRYIEVSEE